MSWRWESQLNCHKEPSTKRTYCCCSSSDTLAAGILRQAAPPPWCFYCCHATFCWGETHRCCSMWHIRRHGIKSRFYFVHTLAWAKELPPAMRSSCSYWPLSSLYIECWYEYRLPWYLVHNMRIYTIYQVAYIRGVYLTVVLLYQEPKRGGAILQTQKKETTNSV